MKALIVYGTRSGATKQIVDEIGKTLTEQGYAVTVKNAADTKNLSVQDFDLIIVGSSVWITKWKGEAMGFLKSNQKVLAGKKVALFSSGIAACDPEHPDFAKKSIENLAEKFPSISPVALAYFGGYVDFNNPNMVARMASRAMKKVLEKMDVDTNKPYDCRDWEAIRQWAKDVATAAKAH